MWKLLWPRQGGMCGICHRPLGGEVHIDHIIPKSRGGSDDDANLQLAHAQCNLAKSDKMPYELPMHRLLQDPGTTTYRWQ